MASRRSRIKGIASIPQRRKPAEEGNIKLHHVETDNSSIIDNISEPTNDSKESTGESSETPKQVGCNDNIDVKIESNLLNLKNPPEDTLNIKTKENDCSTNNNVNQAKPIRRKFIKPLVNIVRQKFKISAENSPEILSNTSPQETSPVIESIDNKVNYELPKADSENSASNIQTGEKEVNVVTINNETEITLNEISLASVAPSEHIVEPTKIPEPSLKLQANNNVPSLQIETEYPPPPPSPSITGRVRIKAIPKLRYRKTSFSASESEDETRKFNRIRNDSICSSTSVNIEVPLDGNIAQKGKEINTIIQKKCNRTEQTRKLAEARREFQRRFGSSAPDRQKLTMMDLIFYNPETNPMEKQESKVADNKTRFEKSEEESVDDPSSSNTVEADKSDEENEVPVPQIKIGPSGEIILDEKSLVVERKDIKRQREQLAKSQIVNGDFDTGYGVYKKHKRSKYWTTDETLRFYKALNTLGTDFTLMCELFPDRTRRELKMKFNKEEKINRTLIDKALMQPCGYDFYVLKEEVELEQREKAELEKLKLEESKKKEERREKELQRKKILKDLQQKMKVEVEQVKQDDNDMKEEKKEKEIQKRKRKNEESEENSGTEKGGRESKLSKKSGVKRIKKARLDINALLEDTEDADESDIDTNSEDEVISSHKPTRSGRMPKVPRKFDVNDEMVVEKIVKKSKDEIEPGSIMIVTEEGPTGEPVYKIFMITQDQERTEIGLNTDVANAIQLKKGITAKNILTISAVHTDDEEIDESNHQSLENNITIPADETVTTLKSKHCASPRNGQHSTEKSDDEEVMIKVDQSIQFPDNIVDEIDGHDEENLDTETNDLTNTDTSAVFMTMANTEKNITITEDATITTLRSKTSHTVASSNSMENQECLNAIKLNMEIDNTIEKSTDYVIFNCFSGNDENIEVD